MARCVRLCNHITMLYLYLGYLFLHLIGLPEFAMQDEVTLLLTLQLGLIAAVVSAVVVSGYWIGSKISGRRIDHPWALLIIGFLVSVIKIIIVRSGVFGYAYLSAADAIAFWIFFAMAFLPASIKPKKQPPKS